MRASLAQVIAAGALGLTACATTAGRPIDELTDARATIRAAEEVNADAVQSAATVLGVARQQAEYGRQLMEAGQNRRAAYVLERAEADASLAIALAREVPLRAEAVRIVEEVKRLQAESERQPPQRQEQEVAP